MSKRFTVTTHSNKLGESVLAREVKINVSGALVFWEGTRLVMAYGPSEWRNVTYEEDED